MNLLSVGTKYVCVKWKKMQNASISSSEGNTNKQLSNR